MKEKEAGHRDSERGRVGRRETVRETGRRETIHTNFQTDRQIEGGIGRGICIICKLA